MTPNYSIEIIPTISLLITNDTKLLQRERDIKKYVDRYDICLAVLHVYTVASEFRKVLQATIHDPYPKVSKDRSLDHT